MRAFLLVLALAATASAQDDLSWSWTPEPRWLDGTDIGRPYFDGGLGFGANIVFSTVPDAQVAPVVIRFDEGIGTAVRVFDYRRGLRDAGVGTFAGAAYDVSDPDNPRRLNMGLVEDTGGTRADGRWNPDGSATGGREWLLVFASDYDGDGATYAGSRAYSLDTYYGFAPRVRDGFALYQTPAELAITPAPLRNVVATAVGNGDAEVLWTAAAYAAAAEARVVDEDTGATLATAPADAGVALLTGLNPERRYPLAVRLLDASGELLAVRRAGVRPAVSRGVRAASSLNPGRAGGSTYGDVWGYVAPDGTEYALLASRGTGLSILDVSAAPSAPPVEVGFIDSPEGAVDAKDVKVYRQMAYLVHERGPIQIIDLSTPSAPVEAGRLDVQPGVTEGGSHNVLVANDHLWVTGGRTSGNAGVRIYSLANPAAPALVGAFRPERQPVAYYHDFEVRGSRGYGSAIYSGGGVDVLDVSDPAAPRLVTTFTYPGAGAHNTCTTEDGQTVYVGDEIGSAGNWMRIFDVSDIENAELVGEIVVDAEAVVHNCYVLGERLFVAHYTEGLRVFDISDPHAPVETAFYDTYLAADYGFNGAWTAYPYLPSGKVLVSDLQSGLFVIALGDASTAEAQAPAAPGTLRIWPNPASSAVMVAYDLSAAADIRLTVFDALGREVAALDVGPRSAGPHRATLDASQLPPGVYLVRLASDGPPATTTITIAR